MRIAALLFMIVLLGGFAHPARAELPTPAAMDKYCNILPGTATASHYHQPDGRMADAQVLALAPGEYVTKEEVHVFVLPSKAYLIRFTDETTQVEATRGPDYMAYWAPEHPVSMGGCSLQQLSEALRRNGLRLWYGLPDDPESWLNIREAEGEPVRIPENKIDTGYIEVYARTPSKEVLTEFCKSVRPRHRVGGVPDMPGPGTYDLAPGGRLEVYEGEDYLVYIVPSSKRVFGAGGRDIFFPGDENSENGGLHALGGCSDDQLYAVLMKNGLQLAGDEGGQ